MYLSLVVYIGNSTVKRITTGETASKEPYDPLAKVKPEKLQKVLDFIKPDLKKRSLNIATSMLMFHRRSTQSKSPYSSSRIAFLDRCFVNSWAQERPPNENPGDCGVYYFKYIECLTLGCSFDG
ncbi:hypothetical protein HID58_066731 [Brassica napus]|uniref:Ubiquitin-like protease family profile domain-containing protein n=1 Tax=Brassica napus TaxID=3708 RepID=A0ABQ7ZGY3_BRANA|nr:hypothetical protein HID58_066731 [Brassica napus]